MKVGPRTAIAAVIAAALVLSAVPPAAAQDPTVDPVLKTDQESNFGRGWSEYARGGSLAWSESYYLESYMNMYEATGDRAWLDKIVDHTDRVLASSVDHDGNGQKGWPDATYAATQLANEHVTVEGALSTAPELVVNGGMEADTNSDDVPDGWAVEGAPGKAYRSTNAADVFKGSAAAVVESDGSNTNRLVQTIAVSAGATYVVEGYIGVEAAKTQALLEIVDTSTGAVVTWLRAYLETTQQYSMNFTAPSSGSIQIRLALESYAFSGFSATFDEMSLKLVQQSTVRNGGMEALNPSDATLPLDWTRWQATSADLVASTDAATGARSIAITTDGAGWKQARQTISYDPSAQYTVHFAGKVSSAAASGRIEIWNQTDDDVLATKTVSSASWSKDTLTFTAPAVAGKNLMITLYQSDYTPVGFTSYFDDVDVVKASGGSPELALNRSFESVHPGDATLPVDWDRASGTGSSDAYLITGINNAYNGYGIAVKASGKAMTQTLAYRPGAEYVLTYWGRAADLTATGSVRIRNVTDSTVLATSALTGTVYTQYAMKFTAPAVAGKTLWIEASAPSASGQLSYFDAFSLKEIVRSEPAGWQRTATTPREAAFRTNDTTKFGDEAGIELIQGAVSPVIAQKLLSYKPGVEYGLSFFGSVSSGASGRVTVYDKTASSSLGSWTFDKTGALGFALHTFTTPAAGHDIEVRIGFDSGASGSHLWIDRVRAAQSWEHMVHEGAIAAPILRFAATVVEDSTLQVDYLAKAESYRDFVADNLVDKWDPYWKQISGTDGADNGTGVYIVPPGLATEFFPGRSLPPNQYLALARMLYLLHDATAGDPAYAAARDDYLSRANDMERAFKSTIAPHPLNTERSTDAYIWHYWDPMGPWDDGHYASYGYEDTAHASLTMMNVLEAYRHGQVFSRQDMEKFTRTFTDILWNQSLTEPVISYSNERVPENTGDRMNNSAISFFSEFAEFDPEVWDIADAVCELDACLPELTSSIAKWSRNKAREGGFEQADSADATLPQGWLRFQSTSTTVSRITAGAAVGSAAVSVKTDGIAWRGLEQPLADYEPDTEYTVSYRAKREGSVNGRVQLYDYTTDTVLGQVFPSSTSWTAGSFTATMPAAGHDVRLVLYTSGYSTAGQEVLFDEVRAFPTLALGELPNAGFESAFRWDASLPEYWTRGSTTVASNAVLDTAQRSSGARAVKINSAANGVQQDISYPWTGYVPGKTYSVAFDAYLAGSAGGRLEIIDSSTSAVLASVLVSGSGWNSYSATFDTPSAFDRELRIVLRPANAGVAGSVWFDDILLDH